MKLLLALVLFSTSAMAVIPDLKPGQIFTGNLFKYGQKPTGKACSVTVIKQTLRPEVGVHCYKLVLQASWLNQSVTLYNQIAHSKYFNGVSVQSCAEVEGRDAYQREVYYDQNNILENFVKYMAADGRTYSGGVFLNKEGHITSLSVDQGFSGGKYCQID